jgi:hypothetical protein
VLAFLGKAGVVDDPRFDRSVALNCRQDHFSHFRQDLLVQPKTFSFNQGDWPTKCSSDWCCAAVRSGAVTAAIGSTLLRSHGIIKPRQ